MSTNRCDYCGEWESDLTELCRCCNHCQQCKLIASEHTGKVEAKSNDNDAIREAVDRLRSFSEW